MSRYAVVIIAVACFAIVANAYEYDPNDFAVEVVDYSGNFGSSPYDDPNSVIGHPAARCQNLQLPPPYGAPDPNFRVKLVEPAYNFDLNGNKVITTINPGEYIVVKFNHKVVDYPGNLYGQDFIVFGNSNIFGSGNISDANNMNTYKTAVDGQFEEIRVSVSQDGTNWFTYDSGPYADDLYPTQAYYWDRENACWTDELMDFTRPVDPNLTYADLENSFVADVIDLYDGSGGGTSYDLQDLTDYENLAIDPNTGYRWIQYVRLDGFEIGGEIDAVSDVAACGDPTHTYPVGDINEDCRVDFEDFALLAGSWLDCTYNCD